MQLGPKTKPKVAHRNRLWHYSGHNPPTWFTDKTGSRIIESNNQTGQSNDQFEQQEQCSNDGASPSQPAIETESQTESTAPELIQKFLSDRVGIPGNPQINMDIISEPSGMYGLKWGTVYCLCKV